MSKSAQKFPLKKIIVETLKWGLALGLLGYLVRSGRLSFTELPLFFSNPTIAIGSFALLFLLYLIAFFRWKLLLDSLGIGMQYFNVFKLGMLGQFFSTVLPGGSVGGDLVKAVFIAKRFPGSRMKSVSTVLLDRILGLAGMLVLGAVAFLLSLSDFQKFEGTMAALVLKLGWLIAVLAVVFLICLILFPTITKKLPAEPPAFIKTLPGHTVLRNLYLAVMAYKDHPGALWKALGISICCHIINVGVFYMVSLALAGPPPWGEVHIFTFVVASIMGLIAMALPIAPAGLGVGQVAFATTFHAIGAPSDAFGANLVTCFQVVSVSLSLIGAFFFATYRNEIELAET